MSGRAAQGKPTRSEENAGERRPSYYLAVVVLSMTLGAAIYEYRLFPYTYMHYAFLGLTALFERYVVHTIDSRYHPFLWTKARDDRSGLTRYQAGKAYPGFTLYASTHDQRAYLLDMAGNVVHTWSRKFSEVWPDSPHVASPVEDESIYWRALHLFPNGDLLVIYIGEGDTPWGYGMAKLDKDSNVLWRYSERVHHDLYVARDGRIYTLAHTIVTEPMTGIPGLRPPYLDDYVVVLSAQGEELERYSILKALRDSDYPGLVRLVLSNQTRHGRGDYTHTNTVDLIEDPSPDPNSPLQEGQILVSIRELGAIALLDPQTGRFSWAIRGSWMKQHDPDVLPDGRILLFDNLGHIGPGGWSRLLEFDPATGAVTWEYAGTPDRPFFSSLRARQQLLPNGNVLVTESSGGRLFEVSRTGEIVWEYVNPHRAGDSDELIAWTVGAVRYSEDSLRFLPQSTARGDTSRTR